MRVPSLRGACLLALSLLISDWEKLAASEIEVIPSKVSLKRNFEQVQFVVTARDATGQINERSEDLTAAAKYVSSDPRIVKVTTAGRLVGLKNGAASITISAAQSYMAANPTLNISLEPIQNFPTACNMIKRTETRTLVSVVGSARPT